ncbi:MAG TPA: RidA family protein [Acidobacteriaceae bacterium]|nr:RidA family protein [Acidobacteriaceae bacterium]
MNERDRNPFPSTDPDRFEIWEILVNRDIGAFLKSDWSTIANDFIAESFVGYSGSSNPDHWKIAFPSLDSYRVEWLRQASEFQKTKLANESTEQFLFRASVLRDIEISDAIAMAHKKIDGRAVIVGGREIVLNWQTIYWLRRAGGHWRISGFLGYLPNPMPQLSPPGLRSSIEIPHGTTQHKKSGPYSPVLRINSGAVIAISGQGPINDDGNIVGDNIQEQAKFTLENCKHQLELASSSFSHVFKVTVYLKDIEDWTIFNEVYRNYFRPPYPVRTAVQAVLWGGIKVEIDMLAVSD